MQLNVLFLFCILQTSICLLFNDYDNTYPITTLNEHILSIQMIYISTFYFSSWVIFNFFIIYHDRENLVINDIVSIPYMIIYNNMCALTFRLTTQTYFLSHKLLWLFTSPYIMYYYMDIFEIPCHTALRYEITLHLFNVINFFIYAQYQKIILNVMMYLLYFNNIYIFYKFKFPANFIFLYTYILTGTVETIYKCKLIKEYTYIVLILTSDLQIKSLICLFNSLRILRKWYWTHSMKLLGIKDIQRLCHIKEQLEKIQQCNSNLHDVEYFHSWLEHVTQTDNLARIRNNSYRKSISLELDLIKTPSIMVKDAVILFSDVVNYSGFSKSTLHNNVLKFLQTLYDMYDTLLTRYDMLQKIENVGDCYMVTSNLSKAINSTDTSGLFLTCMQMFQFAQDVTMITNTIDMNTRVGIHVGDVSIGMVGTDNPKMCVVGHNVNFSARLESTCKMNCIHVSKQFHEIICTSFDSKFKYDSVYVYLKNLGQEKSYSYEGPFNFDKTLVQLHRDTLHHVQSIFANESS